MKKLLAVSLLLVSCSGLAMNLGTNASSSSDNTEQEYTEVPNVQESWWETSGLAGHIPRPKTADELQGVNVLTNIMVSYTQKKLLEKQLEEDKLFSTKSGKRLTMAGAENFVGHFFGVVGSACGQKVVNWFPNEEKELQAAVQQIQVRRANQQLDAEAEQTELMKEIRENIATIRTLNAKEVAGKKLTEQEINQREHAMRSFALMQAFISQHAAAPDA